MGMVSVMRAPLEQEETMTTHIGLWGGSLVVAVLLGAPVFAGLPPPVDQATQATQAIMDGAYLFRTYCASCHGTSARGDGPLADAMSRRPPNLTEFQKRNQGVFSKDLVFRIIDGRQKVRGHGGPDMPVWGDAFTRAVEGGDEKIVTLRIQALVDYLESIQARNTP